MALCRTGKRRPCDHCRYPLVASPGWSWPLSRDSHGPRLVARPDALNIDYKFSSVGVLVDGWGGPRPIYANAVRKVDSDSRPETEKYEKRGVWCEPPPRVRSWFVSYLSAWVDSVPVDGPERDDEPIVSSRLLELAEARELELTERKVRRSVGFRLLRLQVDHPRVLDAYIRGQMMGVLIDIVGLTERQAQCYSLREGRGMSRHAISEALGISRQMVIRHIRTAYMQVDRFKAGGLPPVATIDMETINDSLSVA